MKELNDLDPELHYGALLCEKNEHFRSPTAVLRLFESSGYKEFQD